MTRIVTVGAAQLGPIQREHTRKDVVVRLLDVQGNFVGGKTVTLAATGGATVTPPSGVTSAADHIDPKVNP